MFRTRKSRKGFTLVELLVVVLILSILMAVALPLYLGAINSSNIATARANMQTIANANQAFRVKNSDYTTTLSDLQPDLGSATIKGPGDREYIIIRTGSCDHDAESGTADVAIPSGSFAVQSTPIGGGTPIATDGCFIPGVSTK